MVENKNQKFMIWGIIIVISIIFIASLNTQTSSTNKPKHSSNLTILSSYENKDLEEYVKKYAEKEKIKLDFTYMGDLEMIEELDNHSENYDAVWISNSMWLYMLKNTSIISNSKSISISPVVVGIKRSKAEELGLTNRKVDNNEILALIREKKIKYVMSSVTQTNTGATAYFGFLDALAGNPEILTEDMIRDETLLNDMTSLFSGVERVSKEEDYLEEMFLNSNQYEAVIASEASLININKSLEKAGSEPLYLLYPIDGVALTDSTFGFIKNDNEKEEDFLKIQQYLLSEETQKKLETLGRRTWYGGVSEKVNKDIFNPKWGIDTTTYLNVTKFPSKKVMTLALNLYIEKVRKPTHVVFCLDYSGSMNGEGIESLRNAMNYILTYEEASKDKLQFSEKDKITVITFSSTVSNIWNTDSGYQTEELKNNIDNFRVGGNTALYDAITEGIKILDSESDDYTKTIIALTDGAVNVGSYSSMMRTYQDSNRNIPIYGITFGRAVESELKKIADLTNARVFDGKTDLLAAFKEVRGYN